MRHRVLGSRSAAAILAVHSCVCSEIAGDIDPDIFDGAPMREDAAHIASWHPAVALAVADWLESVGSSWSRLMLDDEQEHALAVATAYLAPTDAAS